MPQALIPKKLKLNGSMKALQDLLELSPKKDFLFIIRTWNAKVGSQEIPEVIGTPSLALESKMKQGKG